MLEYIVSHLREREPRLDDDAARRLFARARATLAELQREFAAYGKPHAAHAARGASAYRAMQSRTFNR
jgi:hypothetical protein